ncbi:hypothetical protein AT575_07960 [Streptococcus penaeicida]|uniref:Competence protein n=1 Tax=Streptococcus penaeicida TaxID=1765960 RepID=A0A2N8LAL8_9STRE|nr:competence type IV pilus minor pilin ComGD [Streptococcus penaeicida]PND47206.1 hypothetical protein AT575_07960 [Streptococcus penaeicida]
MQNIKNQLVRSKIRAFTLFESLLTLGLSCFIIITLSGSVNHIYQSLETNLFFINFENFYRHSQKLSVLKQKESYLIFTGNSVHCNERCLDLPDGVKLLYQGKIRLNQMGGNHSLAKISFQTDQEKIHYQINLGSGTYQKTTD